MADKDLEKRLHRLNDLDDYKVAEGDPDVRGWRFVDGNHDPLGTVYDLIADPKAGQVRYLDVVLDEEFSNAESDRHILVPVGLARVHEDHDDVMLHEITRETLLSCPVYTGPGVTLDYEHRLISKLVPEPGNVARNPSEFYNYEHFNADSFYGPRRANVTSGHYNRTR